jgi:hypothetical protein
VANELVSINSARSLTAEQFAGLFDVPSELEWLANITNAKTRLPDRRKSKPEDSPTFHVKY